ncbi:hypothetical protein [Microbulbifer sp. PAAF003]|uniref:hypothetical protein n=1 Tax=Microbulbifer sp. PAAF003 TaxID=3243375 RepID=UPI004039DF8E
MKNLIIILAIGFALYKGWEQVKKESVEPIEDGSYVAIYGRDRCGWTQKMLKDMKSAGVNYHYYIVDDKEVADTLHIRMEQAGISIRRYNLPVVDVNGELSVRPNADDVLISYRASL